MILRHYRIYFTSCLNIVKTKNVHTARWIIVTGSLIVKNPWFNISHIFLAGMHENQIFQIKEISKDWKNDREFKGFQKDKMWPWRGSHRQAAFSGPHWHVCMRICDLPKGKSQKYQRERQRFRAGWRGKGASVPKRWVSNLAGGPCVKDFKRPAVT